MKISPDCLHGITPVEAALRARRRHFRRLYLKRNPDSDRLARIQELARELGVQTTEVDRTELDRALPDQNHQGVALDCGALPVLGFRDLLDAEPAGIVLALDQVEDPQNFGAMVRSAVFLGTRAILVHRHQRAPVSAAVSKASAGTLEVAEIYECGNLADALLRFAREGWRVIGSTLDEPSVPYHQLAAGGPAILVMGNEGRGLRPLTIKRCTERVMIPRLGPAESLNVSVAAGILLAQLTRDERG